MIRFERLVFDYPGVRALHGVGGALEAGAITALVGPNGAGKTTLMRCLAALETPFEGTILLDGLDVVAEPRRARARIGFLKDEFGLYDELSVRRCLTYAAASRRVPGSAIAARVAEVAALVGLDGLLERRAGALSRGQRQRVGIAQAMIHRPLVLILDEPATGLDPEARAELAHTLRALRGQGVTLLVSSHILAELEEYCTHLLVIEQGRIIDSRAVAADAARARLLVAVLARPDPRAGAVLGALAGVRAVRAEALALEFELEGGDAAQAAVLAALVREGVPVARFAERGQSLQDMYLRRLREVRGGA